MARNKWLQPEKFCGWVEPKPWKGESSTTKPPWLWGSKSWFSRVYQPQHPWIVCVLYYIVSLFGPPKSHIRWWFQTSFIFTPKWGGFPFLTNIFQMGWNHQPAYFVWSVFYHRLEYAWNSLERSFNLVPQARKPQSESMSRDFVEGSQWLQDVHFSEAVSSKYQTSPRLMLVEFWWSFVCCVSSPPWTNRPTKSSVCFHQKKDGSHQGFTLEKMIQITICSH